MTEPELEAYIVKNKAKAADNARFVLGCLLIEGHKADVKKNEKKGSVWMREAANNDHIDSMEYLGRVKCKFSSILRYSI